MGDWNQEGDRELRYFDREKIRSSLKADSSIQEKARRLIQQKQIEPGEFSTGYISEESYMVGQQLAVGIENGRRFQVAVTLGPDKVLHTDCGCRTCYSRYGWYQENQKKCAYVVAAVTQACEYLAGHDVGDSTDYNGMKLMNLFKQKQVSQTVAQALSQAESMTLEPRLIKNEDGLEVSFRYGAARKYVVKELGEFCSLVKREARAVYGSKTELPHGEGVLDAGGRKWYSFIQRVVQEDQKAAERQLRKSSPWGGYYARGPIKFPALDLAGGRMDQFYELMGSAPVEYEDKTIYEKNKRMLYCAEELPHMKMQLAPVVKGARKSFQGVEAQCEMPEVYEGQDAVYFISGNKLCKADRERMSKVMPLLEQARNGKVVFNIGKKNLSEFYYSVLPMFADALELVETDPDTIQANLPPQVEFIFYLDAPGNDLTCRIEAKYGERKVSCLDYYRDDIDVQAFPAFRMTNREQEVVFRTMQLFPQIDLEQEELKCERREDSIYEILSHGLDTLAEMGEIQCTDRFNRLNILKKLKVSVGVSVSQGLLNLDIASTDVSREELLEILQSYRARRKFHRLKNGDFLNLENDESLAMLAEMLETMRISPKEFVKGKMQLPLYRTLYLDKMLENNAGVYNERDSYFKNLVKEFKTVNDADYEEPKALQKIMRNYQRTGYKWLRVLASRGFGGILADEMGLGKTLQMIAVLLAVKQESQEPAAGGKAGSAGAAGKEKSRRPAGTSLIVCPAALVYNWVEEFARFAPGLTVDAITGNQEARSQKIAGAMQNDVIVTSYDLLKRDIDQYEGLHFLYEVIDEAQYIKNHTTAAAKAVKVIKSEHKFALTGTPIENSLSELWSIFDFLMPGFLYGYETFRKEFEVPVVKNNDGDAMKRLQRMAAPFILRRCKNDVLGDLPDKMEESRYVQLEDEQRRLYDAQVVHMQAMLSKQNKEEFSRNKLKVLAELMKLRQICCDPSLCFEGYKGESAKLESCLELVDSAIDGGHRILLFSQFTSMIAILQERLAERGVEFYTITGSTSKEKRIQLVKEFNEGSTPVFLISLKAGGVGLNLTGADVVIHYDPWWNLAVQNQATDRAHRIGQTKKVTVYKLIVRKSIEEKIQKLQETKRSLAEQILDADAADIGSMTREELLELLEA